LALTLASETATVVEQRYFDAWGNLREARLMGGTTVLPNAMGWAQGLLIDRGYTGHEHLTTVGLVHMNGRVYDPVLRQFMSPDNYVQDPYNTQNFNRFGYVLNNPLLYTDPSGEIVTAIVIGAAVAVLTKAIVNNMNGIPVWHGMGKAAVIGGVQGAIGFGIGSIQSSITAATTTSVSAGTQLTCALMGTVMDLVLPKIDIQIEDLSLKLNFAIMMGTSTGFGLQASVSYDDGEFYFGVGYGITYYSNYNGMGINGWEHRASGMAGFGRVSDFRLSLGTNLWWGMKGLDNESLNQQTGVLSIKSGDFGMTYENDGFPFGMRKDETGKHKTLSPRIGDGYDSYRTAAVSLSFSGKIDGKRFENLTVGFNLFTGKRTNYTGDKEKNGNMQYGNFNERYPNGLVREEGRPYRFGGLYVGYKGLRLGIDSDRWVRHPIQNHFAHNFGPTQPGFMSLSNLVSPYFQYRTPNMFTTW
jgi:RHS repeat-associated protein